MAALDSLGDESPNIMEAKDIVEDDEARANRDRYHWSEVDLGSPGGWLKEWMELNLDQQVLYEAEDYKVRLLNTYKDTGECLLHARKGKVFATFVSSERRRFSRAIHFTATWSVDW
jgi:activator of HSP90 ATPase